MAKSSKSDQALETAFNRYTLTELLGQGGAGEVWRATDSSGTAFAVKILDPERATSDRRRRFKNEILFCERTQHPNIVKVLTYGVASRRGRSTPFYVMPIFHRSLRALLATASDPSIRLRYFDQLLSGVEAAHFLGVVHRDLKPENILHDTSNDNLVVADFGIAHFTDEELYTAVETESGARLANFQYAAPEQRVRGMTVDHRADIYALGLILNELFTGVVPQGADYKSVGPTLPDYAWIDEVVAEMIQQDRARRPASLDVVKRRLIAKRQDYVTRQRLSQIQNTVMPTTEEDDPLILDPPKIVDYDWENGNLTLILSRPVNQEWVVALQKMGSYTSVYGKGPQAFTFAGDRAHVTAPDSQVQNVINHFKDWIPKATHVYRERRIRQRRQMEESERAQLLKEEEELQRRQKLRENIRL